MVDRRDLFARLSGQPGPPQPNRAYFMFAALPLNLGLLDDSPPDTRPLVGWPAPDLDLHTAGGTVRLAELARQAKPLLIDLTGTLSADVTTVRATADTDLTAVPLRPDSYVAWASNDPHPDQDAVRSAVEEWFGVPVSA